MKATMTSFEGSFPSLLIAILYFALSMILLMTLRGLIHCPR